MERPAVANTWQADPPPVAAVILSFNAVRTLPKVVSAVQAQSVPVTRMIVVDNGSRDGTREFLQSNLPEDDLLLLPRNLGVGLGHSLGWHRAMADARVELVWALEHDTVPREDCLERLLLSLSAASKRARVGAVVARQQFLKDEAPRRLTRFPSAALRRKRRLDARNRPYQTDRFSFNGTLFPVPVVAELGTPRHDLFVCKEDREYAWRLRRAGYAILRDPNACVTHLRAVVGPFPSIARSYYATRNDVFLAVHLRNDPAARLRQALQLAVSTVKILALGDEKARRLKAKYVAVFDGLRGSLGPKDYAFLADEDSAQAPGENTRTPTPA